MCFFFSILYNRHVIFFYTHGEEEVLCNSKVKQQNPNQPETGNATVLRSTDFLIYSRLEGAQLEKRMETNERRELWLLRSITFTVNYGAAGTVFKVTLVFATARLSDGLPVSAESFAALSKLSKAFNRSLRSGLVLSPICARYSSNLVLKYPSHPPQDENTEAEKGKSGAKGGVPATMGTRLCIACWFQGLVLLVCEWGFLLALYVGS